MKRLAGALKIISLSIFAFSFLMTPFTLAGQKQSSQFLGIWEGVDEQDGSLIEALISNREKQEYKLLWYETYWRTCDGGRGIFKGTGGLRPYAGRILVFDAYVFCFEKDSTEWEGTLTLRQVNNALILATAIQNDNTPAFVDLPLYRVSEPVKKNHQYRLGR